MHKTKNICTDDCMELSDLYYMEFTLLSSASYANSPEKLDQDFKASYGFPYLKSCYHFLSTSVESSWGKWQGVQFDATGVPVVSQTSDSRWKCRLSASRGGSIIYAISAAPWRRDLWSLNGSFMLSQPFQLLLLCTASRFTEITRSMWFKLFCLRALWPTCKLLSPKAFWCEPLVASDLDIMDPVFMCRCGPYYSYRVERLCILGKDQKLYKQHLSNLTIASWLAVSTEPKLNWGILWWQAWTAFPHEFWHVLTKAGFAAGLIDS